MASGILKEKKALLLPSEQAHNNQLFSLASKNELIDHGSTPDMSVEERYYSKEAYAKLTKAQKHGLKLKHEKRGAKKCKPKEKDHAKLPTFSEDGHLIGQKLFV